MTKAANAVAKHKLSPETCIKMLSDSLVFGRKSLKMELPVSIAICAGLGKKAAEEGIPTIMEVYKKAGYEYQDSKDRNYKTANRRANHALALYQKIGQKEVTKWVGDAEEEKLLECVLKGLEAYQFNSMDDVAEFAGRDSNRKRGRPTKEEAARRAEEAGEEEEAPTYRFAVSGVRVEIPQTMSAHDMITLATRILAAARKKEAEELKLTQKGKGKSAGKAATPMLH